MNAKRCEELYASYMAGYAFGKEGRPRTPPALDAPLEDWARELGHVDGLAAVPLRAATDLVRWCLRCRTYERCLAGLDGAALRDTDECGAQATATVELGCQLGARDARTGQHRSPVALADMLRSLGS